MLDLLDLLVDLVAGPRQLVRQLVSLVAQAGFAVLAVPVGCAVLGITTFVGFLLTVLLSLLGAPDQIGGTATLAGFGVGLILASLALIRLYRALPSAMRQAIEIPDDVGGEGPPILPPATALTSAELRSLDAKLAPPSDRQGREAWIGPPPDAPRPRR